MKLTFCHSMSDKSSYRDLKISELFSLFHSCQLLERISKSHRIQP